MLNIVQSKELVGQTNDLLKQTRTPFVLPDRGTDEVFDYVTAIKMDSEVEYLTIAGINFEKKVMPNSASFVSEQEKFHMPKILCRQLTEKQAKAIAERAKEVDIEIPMRQNLRFGQYPDEPEYMPGRNVKASDVIVLCKVSEYGQLEGDKKITNREDQLTPERTNENPKEEMYRVQGKVLEKSKK